MSNNRLKYLLERYAADRCTPDEVAELFEWIKSSDEDKFIRERIRILWQNSIESEHYPDVDWDNILARVMNKQESKSSIKWIRYVAAAILVGVLVAGSYLFLVQDNSDVDNDENLIVQNDIKAPETNRATLTLADGSVIYLDSLSAGKVAAEGSMNILKVSAGELEYSTDYAVSSSELKFNTLHNPKGSQVITVVLSDGSKVWLNAGSSITYPVVFQSSNRSVTMNGEVYFEVKNQTGNPFVVRKSDLQIRVLGTHFNVNAYDDEEDAKVTLLEGSIQVANGKISDVLVPGQQAQVSSGKGIIIQDAVNMDAVMAWKSGRFIFEGENIQAIMRQLARWYNVDVSYEGNVTNEKFVGVFNRSRHHNISGILDMFKKTRMVDFSINENRITVKPFENKTTPN